MTNLIFYLGCLFLLVKGIELLRGAYADPAGSTPRKLGLFGGFVAIAGSVLFVAAGEYVADLTRTGPTAG